MPIHQPCFLKSYPGKLCQVCTGYCKRRHLWPPPTESKVKVSWQKCSWYKFFFHKNLRITNFAPNFYRSNVNSWPTLLSVLNVSLNGNLNTNFKSITNCLFINRLINIMNFKDEHLKVLGALNKIIWEETFSPRLDKEGELAGSYKSWVKLWGPRLWNATKTVLQERIWIE